MSDNLTQNSLSTLTPKQVRDLKKAFEEMKLKASEDPIYFFETFLKIYNPNKTPTETPFKLYSYQKRLIRDLLSCIETGEDVFVDKTREMGVSYVSLGIILWLWLFRPGFTALIGSRKEELVDGRRGGVIGSKDASLFSKLGYMLERLPPFIVPAGFIPKKHFTFMSLINPENGNAVTGESANPNFSRSGRYTLIFLDEFAFWPDAYRVWGGTADATHCRIVVTTPGDRPGKAKRLRFGLDHEKIKIIEVPYYLHPEKNAKWLKEQRERRSEDEFNREIMMDWGLSVKGRIYPELDKASYGKFPFIPNQPLYVSNDYGLDGGAFLFWQQNPKNGKFRLIDSFFHQDEPIEFYFPLFGKPIDSAFTYSNEQLKAFEEISQYPPGTHFGDPSLRKRSGNKDKESDLDKLAAIGIYVYTYTKENTIDYRVKTTKTYLKNGIEINESERNYVAFDLMKAYRWKTWEEDHDTTATFRKPVHNASSHMATAMEYFFVNMANFIGEVPEAPPNTGNSRFITSRRSIRR